MTAPMTLEELLPCPFCAGPAEYFLNPSRGDNSMARCRCCGAEAFGRKWNIRDPGVAQSLAPATWLEHVRAGLQAIVDLKNPLPRAAVREALPQSPATDVPTDPATAAPGQSLRVARELARWIGYDWDGLKDYSIVDRGYPEWTTNSRMYQGGRPDLLRLADALLSPDTTVVPSTSQAAPGFTQCAHCWQPATCKKYGCSELVSSKMHSEGGK